MKYKEAYILYNIKELLKLSKIHDSIDSINNVELMGFTYPDLYKVGSTHTGFYSVKIRDKRRYNIPDSLRCLESLVDTHNTVVTYSEVIETEDVYLLITPWIDGIQPIESNRDRIKDFFIHLAYLNRDNPSSGPYTSMYLDGRKFDTVEEMVDFEVNGLLKQYKGDIPRSLMLESLEPLKNTLHCIIHEDLNTGNMIIDSSDKIRFIDTEFYTHGLNIYQFDHVNITGSAEKKWYNFTDEVVEYLTAYYNVLEVTPKEANRQLKAYSILKELRFMVYSIFKKEDIDFWSLDKKIMQLINLDRII